MWYVADSTAIQKEVSVSPPQQENEVNEVSISNEVCLGAGCYWGTEKYFVKDFCQKRFLIILSDQITTFMIWCRIYEQYVYHTYRFPEALIRGKVGFMGPVGSKKNPTYKEVCSGSTGHVEVFHMTYKGAQDMYKEIIQFFFQFHDPTTMNSQV